MKSEAVVHLPEWGFRIYVWVCTKQEAEKRLKTTIFKNCETVFRDGGKSFYEPGRNPLVWVNSKCKKSERQGTMAHEFLHVLLFAFGDRGYHPTTDDHEPLAYALGYCISEVSRQG
jgi:Zn-dependent peptidase ImmA (M78 family)